MRFSSFLGFGIALLAFVYAVVSLALGLFFPGVAPRGTQTIIVALFFSLECNSCSLVSLGSMSPQFTPRSDEGRWWSSASGSISTP